VIWGVTSVTGAALGGTFLMLLPVLQSNHPGIAGLAFVVLGFGAVALGRDPNGLANRLFALGRWLEQRGTPWLEGRFPGLALRDDSDPSAYDDDASTDGSTEPALEPSLASASVDEGRAARVAAPR
jgi:branched-chain amino acid transport system permease protein